MTTSYICLNQVRSACEGPLRFQYLLGHQWWS